MIYYLSMGLTILANILYHSFQKSVSSQANPVLSLIITYTIASLGALCLFPFFPMKEGLHRAWQELNWATFALGVAIVGLELGFLLLYRSGWNVSNGAIISNVSATLLLVPVGIILFRENLSLVNISGIIVCIIGLILVNYK